MTTTEFDATSTVRTKASSSLERALELTASATFDLDRRFPFVMDRALGAHVWDVDDNRYVDFTSCSGAAPLGSGHRAVLEHTIAELVRTGGMLPGPLSALRVEVAERLVQIFPCAQRAIFFRTGSCATTAAVRLARIHTGKRSVFTSGYHGWHDWQLQYRPTMGLADRDPDTHDFGYDLDQLAYQLRQRPDAAAVIITPEVNFFPPEYVHRVQDLAQRHGALFILDEVMTGFRFGWGGYHRAIAADPDLITISKGLANGTALSAVLGRADVIGAQDRTYLGNTYQREVTPFAAALATLDALADGSALARIKAVGGQLMRGLNQMFSDAGVNACAFSWPSMFDVVFEDHTLGRAFFQEMWQRGYLMQYGGRFMPSAANTDEDVQHMLIQAHSALAEVAQRPGTANQTRRFEEPSGLGASVVAYAEEHFAATPATVKQWHQGMH